MKVSLVIFAIFTLANIILAFSQIEITKGIYSIISIIEMFLLMLSFGIGYNIFKRTKSKLEKENKRITKLISKEASLF